MANLDVDRARELGIAVPPASRDEYLEAAGQLPSARTSDGGDPSVGWTAQYRDAGRDEDGSVVRRDYVGNDVNDLPGQVYLPEQLPDPQNAIKAGFPPQRIPEHLIVDDEFHIQGPEPSERAIAKPRAAIRANVLAVRGEEAAADNTFGAKMEGAAPPDANDENDGKARNNPAATAKSSGGHSKSD